MVSLIVPIIIGVVEVVKRAGLPSQYAPIVSLAIGVFFASSAGFDFENILQGLVYGLAASGLWSGTKAVLGR